jgi:hypothetical protein
MGYRSRTLFLVFFDERLNRAKLTLLNLFMTLRNMSLGKFMTFGRLMPSPLLLLAVFMDFVLGSII